MVNFVTFGFITVSTLILLSTELSGERARQKSSGDRESPWKMPLLFLIGLDVIVLLARYYYYAVC